MSLWAIAKWLVFLMTKGIEEMKSSDPNHKPIAQAIHLPLPLPQHDSLFPITKMTVSGWGQQATGHAAKKLKATSVPLIPIEVCNKTSENMVCAGEGPMNSPGFFGGDSGGKQLKSLILLFTHCIYLLKFDIIVAIS